MTFAMLLCGINLKIQTAPPFGFYGKVPVGTMPETTRISFSLFPIVLT
jgi:hypothetical protein